MIDRRAFITMMGWSILAAPLEIAAQPLEKTHRIGVLLWPPNLSISPLRRSLNELGYHEGQNIVIDEPTPKGYEDLRRAAAELVRLKVDVILALGTPAARTARDVITTIPVVFLRS